MSTKRPSNRQRLEERRRAMPIIDRARGTGKPQSRSVWLRFLRPVVVTLLWLVAVRYAWNHFFGLADDLPMWQQVALYGVAVGVILLLMLGLAPLRRKEFQRERKDAGDTGSTLEEVSEFSNMPVDELAELQMARRLVAHHDAHGALHSAQDSGKPPGA